MDKNIIIAYYSWSGNTDHIAHMIHELTGGQLLCVKPIRAYPARYGACAKQAKQEINSSFLPKIKPIGIDLNEFDTFCIGSPIWWSTMAPPLMTFLSQTGLPGKTIAPFSSHGGGGKGRFITDIISYCPESRILDDLELYGRGNNDVRSVIQEWLTGITLL